MLLLKVLYNSRGKVDSLLILRLVALADPLTIVRLIRIITADLYIKKLVTLIYYTLLPTTY